MASLINSPLLDETGKAILAALQGEEPAEQSGSKIKAPMSDETGKAILEFLQNGGGGGGSAPLVVNAVDVPQEYWYQMDKTWKEIYDAFCAGSCIHVLIDGPSMSFTRGLVIGVSQVGDDQYEVLLGDGQQANFYSCNTEDGYPKGDYYGD